MENKEGIFNISLTTSEVGTIMAALVTMLRFGKEREADGDFNKEDKELLIETLNLKFKLDDIILDLITASDQKH